jgi:hypothetical protein
VSHIKRVHAVCSNAAALNDGAPTAFVARFAQKTLRALSNESRAASPTIDGAIADAMVEDSFQLDLVSLLPYTLPMAESGGRISPKRQSDA